MIRSITERAKEFVKRQLEYEGDERIIRGSGERYESPVKKFKTYVRSLYNLVWKEFFLIWLEIQKLTESEDEEFIERWNGSTRIEPLKIQSDKLFLREKLINFSETNDVGWHEFIHWNKKFEVNLMMWIWKKLIMDVDVDAILYFESETETETCFVR